VARGSRSACGPSERERGARLRWSQKKRPTSYGEVSPERVDGQRAEAEGPASAERGRSWLGRALGGQRTSNDGWKLEAGSWKLELGLYHLKFGASAHRVFGR
jgi:hypothetical protein